MTRLWFTLFAITLAAPCFGDEAQQLFDSIYREKVKRVAATRDRTDDVALAAELLSTAKSSTNQPALLTILCQEAYALALTSPDGYATAADAMQLLGGHVESKRADANAKLIDVLMRQSRIGSTEERKAASEQLVGALTLAGDGHMEAGEYRDAITQYRRALVTATQSRSSSTGALRDKITSATQRSKVAASIDRLNEQLLRDASDSATAAELVNLYVIDLDQPRGALPYLDRAKDATLQSMVPLAAQISTSLNEADSLKLGTWYHRLATKAKGPSKVDLLKRADTYLARFLLLHSANDLEQKKAEVLHAMVKGSLDEIAKQITEAKYAKVETWLSKDASYTVSSQHREYRPLPGFLNGDNKLHLGEFAFHTKEGRTTGNFVTIDLGKPKLVSRIWIENRRLKSLHNRAAGMSMFFKTNDDDSESKVWTTETGEAEWDIKLPKPTLVRFITLRPPGNKRSNFHMAQFKVFGFEEK